MLAPLLSVTIRLLFITALALAVPTTAAADATTVLWVPSGPAAVAEDEAVLRALSDAPPVDRVDRCLATYEQLRESRCRGVAEGRCLHRLGREVGADVVLLRRVTAGRLDLMAFTSLRAPARRARIERASLGRALPLPTCAWLLHGRVTLEPVDRSELYGEELERRPLLDLEMIRRYVGHGGIAVLELLREAEPAVTDEVDVSARPRNVGGLVAVHHDFD